MSKNPDKPVSIKDVARHAGVSISTVSHTLRGSKYVSPELQQRVHEAIAALDYAVNPVASGLKSRSTKTIGVIIPNMNRIFFTQVIKGIQAHCGPAGYNLTLCDTDDQLEREKYFVALLRQHWADGIILSSVAGDADADHFDALAHLGRRHRPIAVVSIERVLGQAPIDAVYVNNRAGGSLAARHLLECGCRRIAHITGPLYAPMVQDRLAGCKAALVEAGVGAPRVAKGDFSPLSGYRCMKKLLQAKQPPDGVFAANDQMAVGALQALREAGRRTPEDIKVVGFDDSFVASIVSPALTTVHVPKRRMGLAAATQLLKRIAEPQAEPVRLELPIELAIRQTTARTRNAKIELADW